MTIKKIQAHDYHNFCSEKRVGGSSKALLKKTKNALQLANEECDKEGLSLSFRKTEKSIWIAEVLDGVFIDRIIIERLDYLSEKHPKIGEIIKDRQSGTLGQIIRQYGFMESAKNAILNIINDIKNYLIDDGIESYFRAIYLCLEHSSIIVKASLSKKHRSNKIKNNEYRQEYCSLCWRLVNKYKRMNFSISDSYSNHYCEVHHPSHNTKNYHSVRNKLMTAVNKRGIKSELLIIKRIKHVESRRDINARYLYHFLSSFSAPPKTKKLKEEISSASSWTQVTEIILDYAYKNYPKVQTKTSKINLKNTQNWEEWFLEVIKALGSSDDLASWLDTKDFALINSEKQHKPHEDLNSEAAFIIGWRVIINIFSRYQAYQNVINAIHKPGPDVGKAKKNIELRKKVKMYAKKQLIKNGKINAAEIGRKTKRHRQQINKLLHELNLR